MKAGQPVVMALVGVTVVILGARGALGNAWAALLGGDPHGARITPVGKVACWFSATASATCVESAAQCAQFGGQVRPDVLGYCGPPVPDVLPAPPAGAAGSGVTTQ